MLDVIGYTNSNPDRDVPSVALFDGHSVALFDGHSSSSICSTIHCQSSGLLQYKHTACLSGRSLIVGEQLLIVAY